MKKLFLSVLMLLALSLIIAPASASEASGASSAEIEPITAPQKEASSPLTPALNIISANFDMAKSGLIGHSPVFSKDDFCRALNLSRIEAVTVLSLPEATSGRLLLGTTAVSVGQVISGANLDALVFSPASNEKSVSSFDFTVDDRGYRISCAVYMLDKINASPTVSHAAGITLDVDTHTNTPSFGKLSAHDPEGDALRFDIVSYPDHGIIMLTDAEKGEYVYLPVGGYAGKDSFCYVARDKYGNYSASATVSLKVTRPSIGIVYKDMALDPANNAALTLTEAGIMGGVQNGDSWLFDPNSELSRVDFTVMAMKAAGITELPTSAPGFTDDGDIPSSALPYISAAKQLGYIEGTENENGQPCFAPNERITRGEAALIVSRMIEASKLLSDNSHKPVFSDAKDVPAWAEAPVSELNRLGMLDDENGRIDATGKLSRADAAVMLAAVLKLK